MRSFAKVHLVGSIPLDDAANVFGSVARSIGPYVHAIPDGETGERSNWIDWQKAVMEASPMLCRVSENDGYGSVQVDTYRLRPDYEDEIAFPELGYADAAIKSYQEFAALKVKGTIGQEVRFQVALPTPFAPLVAFIEPADFERLESPYCAAMKAEVERILDFVPLDELAVQWDAALEFAVLEKVFPAAKNQFEYLVEKTALLCDWIPAETRLGLHLCYGDAGHKHFVEPTDTGLMVRFFNAVSLQAGRLIDWLHLPVPVNRSDSEYFGDLSELRLADGSELYLGLIHLADGVEGALGRIQSASNHVKEFGVATECGFGRRPPEQIEALLELHAKVIEAAF